MKKLHLLPLVVAMISVIFFSIPSVTAANPLDLTGVNNFAILANTYTNTGEGTVLNGDLGYTVPPATPPTVSGATFNSTNPTYIAAEAIQANLIVSANNPTQTGDCTTTLTAATVLDSLTQPLLPGVYCITGAVSINEKITFSGDGVYIFRMSGALNSVANSIVTLDGNAKADNVFWVPVGATTLGANSVFAGNVLSDAAITVGTTVNMTGRILSNGAVTTGTLVTITATQDITPPVDTVFPVITLLGANPQGMVAGSSYVELGATASDNKDGNITNNIAIDINELITTVPGKYPVYYVVMNSLGNITMEIRTVIVESVVDTTNPSLSIESPADGSTLSTPDVTISGTASDDNSLASVQVSIDGNAPVSATGLESWSYLATGLTNGTHTVVVTATDSAGNHATPVTRTVNIVDIIPPVTPGIITLFDKVSCEALLAEAVPVWNSDTSTCTVGTLVIGPGDELVIASNVNFDIGTVTSSGVIVNDGRINIASGGVITTSGALTNNGMIASNGTITNSGPFDNFGILASSGTITNNPTGVIQNIGIITSSGVITSSGAIQVNSTGMLISSGVLTNTLNMVNEGTIMTSGIFTNSGPVENTGYIINQGLITNSNTITNSGNIFNLCGGSITNSGTIAINTVIEQCVS